MSDSKIEEIIAVLWLIAGLVAFNVEFDAVGWFCIFKSAMDTLCSIRAAVKEIKKGE